MRRGVLPWVGSTLRRKLSSRRSTRRGNGTDFASRPVISRTEARRWARVLIDQYGCDAEELAETGVIEMLALKNGAHLVAWAMIYAALRDIRSREPGRN